MTRQRGAGEGSIYKRADDGRWVGAAHLGYEDGKRRRKVVYGKTRREVQEALTRALGDHQAGRRVSTDERLTTGAFLERWLIEAVQPAVRHSTFESYAYLVRLHLVPALGSVRLRELTPRHVQAMITAKLAAGLAPRTVHHLRAVLRRALNQAMRWEVVTRNVATLVDPPRVPRYELTPLNPDQARRLLEVIRGDRLEALYTVALAIGLRQGEALGLRWEDVDFEAGELRVRQSLQRGADGRLILGEPKSSTSRRTIALPAVALTALREHRRRQAQEQLLAGSRWQGDQWGLVFSSTIGTPADGTAITKRFQRLLADAGLPRQRFHDLRHACASLLLAQGIHPRVVMEILGHSQISLTMNTYSHVIPELQRKAADRMEDLLAGGTG